MSWVANMLLNVSILENRRLVDDLNHWLDEEAPWNVPSVPPGAKGVGRLGPLHEETTAWGGWKNPECSLWGGTLNHADLDAVISKVGLLPWEHPDSLQLLLKDQEQDRFDLWMILDGRMTQLTPTVEAS